jgi:hypothetical protein
MPGTLIELLCAEQAWDRKRLKRFVELEALSIWEEPEIRSIG